MGQAHKNESVQKPKARDPVHESHAAAPSCGCFDQFQIGNVMRPTDEKNVREITPINVTPKGDLYMYKICGNAKRGRKLRYIDCI